MFYDVALHIFACCIAVFILRCCPIQSFFPYLCDVALEMLPVLRDRGVVEETGCIGEWGQGHGGERMIGAWWMRFQSILFLSDSARDEGAVWKGERHPYASLASNIRVLGCPLP